MFLESKPTDLETVLSGCTVLDWKNLVHVFIQFVNYHYVSGEAIVLLRTQASDAELSVRFCINIVPQRCATRSSRFSFHCTCAHEKSASDGTNTRSHDEKHALGDSQTKPQICHSHSHLVQRLLHFLPASLKAVPRMIRKQELIVGQANGARRATKLV